MIYLIRHGETDGNIHGGLRGSYFDDELNAKGHAQAKEVAKQLQGIDFDVVYCSPLKRTRQTLAPIYSGKAIFEKRLMPREYGETVGMTLEQALAFGLYCRERNITPKNGESFRDFENRIRAFLDEIKEKHEKQNVLVVTHASICNMTKAILDNFSSDREIYLTKNCEIIKIPN